MVPTGYASSLHVVAKSKAPVSSSVLVSGLLVATFSCGCATDQSISNEENKLLTLLLVVVALIFLGLLMDDSNQSVVLE